MQVSMLGPLEVRAGSGCVLEVRGTRLRALMILLALETGKVVTASRLADALWGDDLPASAANALQALVSRLRRALPEMVVTAHPAGYQLVLDPGQVDAFRFERLAAGGRAQLRSDPGAAAATLRDALALWRGPALADVAAADFAQSAIARPGELKLTAIQDRIDADLRLGVTVPLIAELEGLVAAHPLREPLTGRLMRALQASGQPSAALAVYDRARSRLADELGTEPSADLAALHLAILRAGPGPLSTPPGPAHPAAGSAAPSPGPLPDAPPPEAPPASPAGAPAPEPGGTNLRAELTSFVGRDSEITEVRELVAAHRLITLTGPGGAGKTRLAVEAARTELAAMPGGVWLTEFAPVTDPAEVTHAVLAALGLRDPAVAGRRAQPAEAASDPLSRLVDALDGQQALLVLDNCEHLVAAVAVLADRVLAACPQVQIVATSREPLNIPGEMLWPVRPLALPPEPETGSGPPDPAVIAGYASVQLLAQRARAASPGFEVTAANAAAVARICRALDGMPLAIELAAARLRAMDAEQVAARLDDRFRLLTGGSRLALPRHQTLRAVVDWSWDLLDDAERAVWRRFSVFAGGATLEAAEQVCAGGPVAAVDVLDLLTMLVDKSLLTVRHGGDGPRYLMLEIIRAYGQVRLAEAGEQDTARVAHGRFFLDLADQAREPLMGSGQLHWLRRLSGDQDNMTAAIRGAAAAGDAELAVSLAGALGWSWWLHGMKAEGAELISEALGVPGDAPTERRAVAYTMGALLSLDVNPDNAELLGWFRTAADLSESIENPDNPVLRLVAPLRWLYEQVDQATGPVQSELLDELIDDPHPWIRATARMLRGHMGINFGRELAAAEADFRSGLGIYLDLGERWGTAFALVSVASLDTWRGEYAAAQAWFEKALVLVNELGAPEDAVFFRLQLARVLWLQDKRGQAQACLGQALHDAGQIGVGDWRGQAHAVAGDLARLDGDLDAARSHLTLAWELLARQKISPHAMALYSASLGQIDAAEGDLDSAREHLAAALTAGVSSKDAPILAQVLIGAADVMMCSGEPARAAELLGASVAVRGMPDQSAVDYPRIAAVARAALGGAGYEAAYRRGRSVTIENAVELAGLPAPAA